ncbi:MAG: CPBP family intramembrane metalloprotease [Bryobacteraceae bacterium]|nr:CPBP family intramembrane metalloprotease [Bryobacteraceae bacterium]
MTPRGTDERAFWGFEDVLLFFGLSLPALLLANLLVRLMQWTLPGVFSTKAMQVLPMQFVFYLLLFSILWILMRTRYQRPVLRSLGWTYPFPWRWTIMLLGPVLAFSLSALGAALKAPVLPMAFDEMAHDRTSVILLGLFVTTLGPICEEVVFRGFLYPVIAGVAGAAAGIVSAALIFGMLHGPQYSWSWQHVVVVSAAGIAFGFVRWFTGSTAASALLHATYNLTVFAGFLVQTGWRS